MKKASLHGKLVMSFGLLMILLLFCQLGFNLFFATEYYVWRMSQTMEKAYEDIEQDYEGSLDSIEETLMNYENNYNIDFNITQGEDTSLYTTSNRFNQHRPQPRPGTLPANDRVEDTSSPDIVMHENGNPKGDVFLLSFEESFTYEGQNISVVMLVTLNSIESSVTLFTGASVVITCVVLLLGLLLFYLLSKSITKPIGYMQNATERIAKLDFTTPLKEIQPSRELSSLAQNINSMAFQLEHTIEDLNTANTRLQSDVEAQKQMEQMRREFVANVSHEMKTPLALLQIYADNLKNNVDDVDKDEYCEVIIEESKNLSDMVSSMLEVSALENGLSVFETESLDFSALVEGFVAKMRPLAEEHSIQVNIQPGLQVQGNAYYLQQAVKNYLSNALEHCPKEGRIEVCLVQEEGKAVFSVYNEGSHLQEEDIPNLWNSFYRAGEARVRQGGNVGMGLHIVKAVVERHGGCYEAHNQAKGVCFSFGLSLIQK